MITAIALTIVGVLDMMFGLTVFMRERGAWVNRIFMIFVSALSVWTWGIALFIMSTDIIWSQYMANTYYIAAMLVMVTLVIYLLVVREDVHIWSKSIIVVLPAIVLVGALIAEPRLILSVVDATAESYSERVIIHNAWYFGYALVVSTLFCYALYLQYRKYRHEHTRKARDRERIILGSMSLAGCVGLLFNLILPWTGQYDFIALGPIFAITFIVGIAYSIFKYSPYDLKQAFVRSLSYILSLSAITLIYALAVWMFGSGVILPLGRAGADTMYLVVTLLTALTFAPIKHWFDIWTARFFFRNAYDPKYVLDSYGDLVASSIDLETILEGTAAVLHDTLHPEFVAVLLVDTDGAKRLVRRSFAAPEGILPRLRRAEADCYRATMTAQTVRVNMEERDRVSVREVGLISRMHSHDAILGYLVLGHKHSGESYSSLDMSIITTMTDELALAVQNTDKYQEIEQFNIRLRREVARATRKLRESNAELLEMDRVKDEFVSMASHQLRTPLTSIKGYLSMLLDGDAGEIAPQQRKFLQEAYMSSERMVRLISDFLNVSRLQTGKFMLDVEQTDLIELVRHCVNQSIQLAAGRNMKIIYHHTRRVPRLCVDSNKLTQVVSNFVDNAVYYTPDGGRIMVTLDVSDGEVVLQVRDNGIGIESSEQRQLFTKFFRAENARIQRSDGTGIGLYLAKRIIDAHGGRVVFHSTLGEGSTFGFRLPVAKLCANDHAHDLSDH